MNELVFDTSVYIPLFRKGRLPAVTERPTIYLSIVVAQELLAGAGDEITTRAFLRFFQLFEEYDRLLVPSRADWTECGQVLARLGRRHGYESIKRGRLVNDVLIALSCREVEATLVTTNLKDFALIQHYVDFSYSGLDLVPLA